MFVHRERVNSSSMIFVITTVLIFKEDKIKCIYYIYCFVLFARRMNNLTRHLAILNVLGPADASLLDGMSLLASLLVTWGPVLIEMSNVTLRNSPDHQPHEPRDSSDQ